MFFQSVRVCPDWRWKSGHTYFVCLDWRLKKRGSNGLQIRRCAGVQCVRNGPLGDVSVILGRQVDLARILCSDRANFTWGRIPALPPVRQLKPYVFAGVDAAGASGPVAEAMSCK